MTIRVQLFGQLADAIGERSVALSVPGETTCGELRLQLARKVPGLGSYLKSCRLAVNHQFAADHQPITAADEVALIGLVCGG